MCDVRCEEEPQRQGGTERHRLFRGYNLSSPLNISKGGAYRQRRSSSSAVALPPSYDYGGRRAKADASSLRQLNNVRCTMCDVRCEKQKSILDTIPLRPLRVLSSSTIALAKVERNRQRRSLRENYASVSKNNYKPRRINRW
jgi:hypothetical protein